jgi:hypothetical protein
MCTRRKNQLPAVHSAKERCRVVGLMSYGPNWLNRRRRHVTRLVA